MILVSKSAVGREAPEKTTQGRVQCVGNVPFPGKRIWSPPEGGMVFEHQGGTTTSG